jgi:hypothetical protein
MYIIDLNTIENPFPLEHLYFTSIPQFRHRYERMYNRLYRHHILHNNDDKIKNKYQIVNEPYKYARNSLFKFSNFFNTTNFNNWPINYNLYKSNCTLVSYCIYTPYHPGFSLICLFILFLLFCTCNKNKSRSKKTKSNIVKPIPMTTSLTIEEDERIKEKTKKLENN